MSKFVLSKIYLYFLVICTLLIFSACFSPWKGDETRITLQLGGTEQGRAVYPPDDATLARLLHFIELTTTKEKVTFQAGGAQTIEAVITSGRWDITVISILDNEPYAFGTVTVDLMSGENNFITVPMYRYYDINFETNGGTYINSQITHRGGKIEKPEDPQRDGFVFFGWFADEELKIEWDFETDTVNGDLTLYAKWIDVHDLSLGEFLEWLQDNAQSNRNYTYQVRANESIAPKFLNYSGRNNINITLVSDGSPRTISLTSNGSLFTVGNGFTLILENITLQGRNANNASLIVVDNGGSLVMKSGAKITGNTYNGNWGSGGVFVLEDGTMTMEGGEVTGNRTAAEHAQGGGVLVHGTLNMSGEAAIHNNIADDYGGGVMIAEGTFYMSGNAAVYNNQATAQGGGGVNMHSGRFEMSDNAKIDSNRAGNGSGGMNLSGSSIFRMSGNAVISNNQMIAAVDGDGYGSGGVAIWDEGLFIMESGEITGNTTNRSGGGVYTNGTFNMSGEAKIYGNKAYQGGGIACGEDGTVFMSGNATVFNNEATIENGGGVHMYNGNFVMSENASIRSNTTLTNAAGGGVFLYGGTFTMEGGVISENTSHNGGGVFIMANTTFLIKEGIVYGNDGLELSNTATASNRSHAIFLDTSGGTVQYLNTSGLLVDIPLELFIYQPGNFYVREKTIRVENGELIE